MNDLETITAVPVPELEITERQMVLFVRMLEMYLEWAESVPEIAAAAQRGEE